GGAFFAPDGLIHVVWEDSTHPPQVIALDPATGRPMGTLLAAPDIPPCRPCRSVSFASTDGQQIQGWLAVPDGPSPFPTLLHIHGGAEAAMTDLFFPGSQSWLDHGFAFLSINYRGSTTFGRAFLEQIWGNLGRWEVEDMVAAREWLVTEGIADPLRVFVAGGGARGGFSPPRPGGAPRPGGGGGARPAPARPPPPPPPTPPPPPP